MKQLITKTSIKKILSACAFDPHRSLFKVAVQSSDADYSLNRSMEFIEEAKLTREPDTIKQAIKSLVLAIAFLEKEERDGTKEFEET